MQLSNKSAAVIHCVLLNHRGYSARAVRNVPRELEQLEPQQVDGSCLSVAVDKIERCNLVDSVKAGVTHQQVTKEYEGCSFAMEACATSTISGGDRAGNRIIDNEKTIEFLVRAVELSLDEK